MRVEVTGRKCDVEVVVIGGVVVGVCMGGVRLEGVVDWTVVRVVVVVGVWCELVEDLGVWCELVVDLGIWVVGVTIFTFEYNFLDKMKALMGIHMGVIPFCWRASLKIERYSFGFSRPLLSVLDTMLVISKVLYKPASAVSWCWWLVYMAGVCCCGFCWCSVAGLWRTVCVLMFGCGSCVLRPAQELSMGSAWPRWWALVVV